MKNQLFFREKRRSQNALPRVVCSALFVVLAGCENELPLHQTETITETPQNLAQASNNATLQSAFPPVVSSVVDLGVVARPGSVLVRDGGSTALVGDKILWLFGDTIFKPGFVAADGEKYRSNTAALASPESPLAVTEPLDANGTPYQAIPFTAAEKAYNDSTGKPDDRIALWPGGFVSETHDPDDYTALGHDGFTRKKSRNGLQFFLKVHVLPGTLNYQALGVGTARFTPGKTTAHRDRKLLFKADEPQFSRAFLHQGMVYLYGKLPAGSFLPYGVARAPLKKATQRSAYQFWNGSAWVSDIAQTAAVMYGIPGSVTVSYNAHLRTFIAIHSQAFSDKVVIRTAPAPEGPWSAATELFTGMASSSNNYAAQEHPELAKNNGQTIYVSYFNPQGFLHGEVRLVEVTFQ